MINELSPGRSPPLLAMNENHGEGEPEVPPGSLRVWPTWVAALIITFVAGLKAAAVKPPAGLQVLRDAPEPGHFTPCITGPTWSLATLADPQPAGVRSVFARTVSGRDGNHPGEISQRAENAPGHPVHSPRKSAD